MRVVYYHMVSDSKYDFFNGHTVSKKKFRDDVAHYSKHYDVITFRQIEEYQKKNKSLKNCLIITFDDGYKENYINVSEILNEFNLKATFFLTSSTLGNRGLMWRDALTYLTNHNKKTEFNSFRNKISEVNSDDFELLKSTKNLHYPSIKLAIDSLWEKLTKMRQEDFSSTNQIYLNDEDVKELIKNGHEIGLHSHFHPNFASLTEKEAVDEIMMCYQFIKSSYNYTSISMSFPFGNKFQSQSFYKSLMNNTELKYFSGINYRLFSNRKSNDIVIERLGMEDNRNFFISFYLRPLIRLLK